MAAYRKRNNKWNVQIRKSEYPLISKTFAHKRDAQNWAVATERQIQLGEYMPEGACKLETLWGLLEKYKIEVSIRKRGADVEVSRISKMLKHPLASVPLHKLSSIHVTDYRDSRLKVVSGTTVKKELQIISHSLEIGRKEWGINKKNVVLDVTKPREPRGRERRLEGDEERRLLEALSNSDNYWIRPLVELAIETGMRRGELLLLTWQNIDVKRRTALLPITKNGDSRTIPLSSKSIRILNYLPRHMSGRLFPISSEALRGVWRRTTNKLGIEDLRFHDLRHEATSRFFEKGLNVMEVAAITGHKDLRMLQRYTHLRAEDLAKKLG